MDLPKTIESKRLNLRPFSQEDFEFFMKIIKDDLIFENLKYIINKADLKNPVFLYQSFFHSEKTSDPIISLIITKKDTSEYIGFCGLRLLANINEAICFYSLLPIYRGFGFAIEAMKKLIEYAFLKLNLAKISTYINSKSTGIWKVAERIGMKYLGQIQIRELPFKAMYFSIEKKEFDAQQVI